MGFEIVEITELSAALLTVSAVVMVIVEMLKPALAKISNQKEAKYFASVLISIAVTFATGISVFEGDSGAALYLGIILAGLVASLGANFIHEIMKVLQTVKDLKETGKKLKR